MKGVKGGKGVTKNNIERWSVHVSPDTPQSTEKFFPFLGSSPWDPRNLHLETDDGVRVPELLRITIGQPLLGKLRLAVPSRAHVPSLLSAKKSFRWVLGRLSGHFLRPSMWWRLSLIRPVDWWLEKWLGLKAMTLNSVPGVAVQAFLSDLHK